MPLVDPSARRVQAPARAGIGLRGLILLARFRRGRIDTSWPDDWWQRDLDDQESWSYSEPDLTARMKNVPPAPVEP